MNTTIAKVHKPQLRYKVDMTVAEQTALIRAYMDELIADKAKGRTFFQEMGIMDKNGNLSERYSRTE